MARQTNTRLREKVIYSVFVRNHTKEGTFQALEGDLDRLAALGTDIIWPVSYTHLKLPTNSIV